jgi:hypothetical protein
MRGSYIAHFTNVSMRFTTSGGLVVMNALLYVNDKLFFILFFPFPQNLKLQLLGSIPIPYT